MSDYNVMNWHDKQELDRYITQSDEGDENDWEDGELVEDKEERRQDS